MLKYGLIKEIDADKGLVKVSFDDDEIVSGWLPVLKQGTKSNKYFHIFDSGEHVACMMDEHCENGVVMGAIYSKDEKPGSVKGADIAGVVFSDGTVVKYDRGSHKLTIQTDGNVEITAEKMLLTGDLEVTGKIKATQNIEGSGDIKATGDIQTTAGDVKAGLITLKLHKHSGVTTGPGVSGTPIP
jgi:phage baseplate assembly protein V